MVFAKKLIGLINHDHHRATQEVARYVKMGQKIHIHALRTKLSL
jgi:hypothetical protein